MPEPTLQFSDTLKQYLDVDDVIKQKLEELKELKDNKKNSEEYILNYMSNVKQSTVSCGKDTLRKNEYVSKGSLKIEQMKEIIGNEIKNPELVERIFKIFDEKKNENKIKRMGIKRTKQQSA